MLSLESECRSDFKLIAFKIFGSYSRVTVATILTIFAHARNFCFYMRNRAIAQSRNCYAQAGRSASRRLGLMAGRPQPCKRTRYLYRAGMGPGRGPRARAACSHVHMHERARTLDRADGVMDVIYKVRETVSQCVYQLALGAI